VGLRLPQAIAASLREQWADKNNEGATPVACVWCVEKSSRGVRTTAIFAAARPPQPLQSLPVLLLCLLPLILPPPCVNSSKA
jgi:hypothetical protein